MSNFSKGLKKDSSGNVGVNKDPVVNFDVEGEMKAGYSVEEVTGAIRWNVFIGAYEYFNGTDWFIIKNAENPGVIDYRKVTDLYSAERSFGISPGGGLDYTFLPDYNIILDEYQALRSFGSAPTIENSVMKISHDF